MSSQIISDSSPRWDNLDKEELTSLQSILEKLGLSKENSGTRTFTVLGLYIEATKKLTERHTSSLQFDLMNLGCSSDKFKTIGEALLMILEELNK